MDFDGETKRKSRPREGRRIRDNGKGLKSFGSEDQIQGKRLQEQLDFLSQTVRLRVVVVVVVG